MTPARYWWLDITLDTGWRITTYHETKERAVWLAEAAIISCYRHEEFGDITWYPASRIREAVVRSGF